MKATRARERARPNYGGPSDYYEEDLEEDDEMMYLDEEPSLADHGAFGTTLGWSPSQKDWNKITSAVRCRDQCKALVELWRLYPTFASLLDQAHVDMSAVEAMVSLMVSGPRGFAAASRIFMKLSSQWHTGALDKPSAWLVKSAREAQIIVQRQEAQDQADLDQRRQWESQGWGPKGSRG
jgi:hypothetical protein